MSKILTVEVPGAPEIAGETKPRRNIYYDGKDFLKFPEHATTTFEVLLRGVQTSGDLPFLGKRSVIDGAAGPYVWESYNEVLVNVKNFGYYLHNLGLKRQQNIGLFSVNRSEWVVAEQGSFSMGLSTVPLYDTLGAEAVEFIIKETELSLIVCTSDRAKFLLDLKEKAGTKINSLNHIIVMDQAIETLISRGAKLGITIISFKEAQEIGKASPVVIEPSKPEELATICYTSGTTGPPKGVKLTHVNMIGFLASVMNLIKAGRMYQFSTDDVYISYLPLAHVMERECFLVLMYHGARVGFYQGDTLKLLDDVAELKPTVFGSVPRLYNRIYDRVLAGVKAKGGVAQTLFETAFAAKKAGLAKGYLTHFLWDRLVFGTVRARLGGRVKMMLTGAAPLSGDVIDFLRICFSVEVYEGYGQTETAAALTITDRADYTGRGGLPLACAEIKLVDVPSMNYTSKDKPFPRGEIMVRGTNLFIGYHNAPEKTAETIDTDGWVHTGDIGQFDAQGRLQIIDRLKNIFKLSQGEYIAPEKIENTLIKHELVAQAFVYGDSIQSTIVAIIVPDEDTFVKWANEAYGVKSFEEHAADAVVVKALLKQLDAFCRTDGLKGFEIVKAIHIDTVQFSMENNLFTPSFKLKRHEAKIYYSSAIKTLYDSL
ncbi:Long chain acyl-CoA synthetase 7 peroxisomal, partial [Nowakowskiella sp. JEL0078]